MGKLELKHIVGYLPYRLQAKVDAGVWELKKIDLTGEKVVFVCYSNCRHEFNMGFSQEDFKPILRPMSDIVNPCLKDGKIPVEEIAKIHIGYDEAIEDSDFKAEYSFSRQMRIDITWLNPISKERLYSDDLFIQTDRTHLNRYWVNEWLYQHHFDIHNLIGQGLAIGINTLK